MRFSPQHHLADAGKLLRGASRDRPLSSCLSTSRTHDWRLWRCPTVNFRIQTSGWREWKGMLDGSQERPEPDGASQMTADSARRPAGRQSLPPAPGYRCLSWEEKKKRKEWLSEYKLPMRCHTRTQGIGETLFVLISDSLEDAVLGRRRMTALLPSDPEQQEGKTTRCCSDFERSVREVFTDRRSPACTS